MVADHHTKSATRRGFLLSAAQLAGGVGLLSIFPCSETGHCPTWLQAAIKKVIGDAPLRKGRVTLGLPRWSRTATPFRWKSPSKAR